MLFDFASGKITELFHREKDLAQGLSVSPDGRWLLYSQIDEQNSDIIARRCKREGLAAHDASKERIDSTFAPA
jgi:hypothetical protein